MGGHCGGHLGDSIVYDSVTNTSKLVPSDVIFRFESHGNAVMTRPGVSIALIVNSSLMLNTVRFK